LVLASVLASAERGEGRGRAAKGGGEEAVPAEVGTDVDDVVLLRAHTAAAATVTTAALIAEKGAERSDAMRRVPS